MDSSKSGALGVITMVFLVVSYSVCVVIAVIAHFAIKPGEQKDAVHVSDDMASQRQSHHNLWLDMLR